MDVRRAFEWTLRNIDKYNGSPNRIILAGQSAGAHITLCALVQAFEDELKDNRMKAQLDEATKKLNTSIRVPKKNDSDNDDGTPSSEKSEPITPKYDEFYRRTHAISQSPIPPPIAIPLSALTSPPSNKSSMDMNEPSALTATDTQTIDTMTNKEFLDHTLMYVGISGPYNLEYLYAHFHKRGLDASILNYIFLERYHKYSPTKRFEDLTSTTTAIDDTMAALKRHGRERKLSSDILPPKISSEFDGRRDTLSNKLSSFPPVALFHGTTDKTIPSEVAAELARTLHSGGASVWLTEYEGWSHTDPILEGPMCGDNALFHDIKSCVDQVL
jgi:acetyl esterase/lipase